MNDNEIYEQLAEIIGEESAQRVASSFAGENIYIPKGIITSKRHDAIRQEFRDGATYRELARRHGYSERYIRTVIHRKHK